MKSKMIAVAVAWVGLTAVASTFPALDQAHEAFVRGDLNKMVQGIRFVLSQDPPESVKKNAIELLESAYARYPGQNIPSDWKLPVEIRKLKIQQRRVEAGGDAEYALKVSGNSDQKNRIKQIQLVKYPNQIVLDKEAKVGEWQESVEDNPAEGIYFELDGDNREVPATEGLYLLNLVMTSGAKVNGWVILSDITSSRAPRVQIPLPNETFTTGNPTFRYEDFKSPEIKDYEKRSAWLAVIKVDPGTHQYDDIWKLYTRDLPKTEVTVGKEADAVGVASLVPGNYRFYATYKEERVFGEVRLGRQSVTRIPFLVK